MLCFANPIYSGKYTENVLQIAYSIIESTNLVWFLFVDLLFLDFVLKHSCLRSSPRLPELPIPLTPSSFGHIEDYIPQIHDIRRSLLLHPVIVVKATRTLRLPGRVATILLRALPVVC